MEPNELVDNLYIKYPRIWRCADSFKWDFMKNTNLLSFNWIDSGINYQGMSKKDIGKGHKAIFPFVNELKVGDLIFVMSKNNFFGIAICESEYNFNGLKVNLGATGDKPAVKVKYIFKSDIGIPHPIETHNNPTTFAKIDQYNFGLSNTINFLDINVPEAFKALEANLKEKNEPKIVEKVNTNTPSSPLNQIFFGPPGTGKTYNTINVALRIVGIDTSRLTRLELKEEFDKKLAAGQIIFTTFHQSMNYEEFIEGIKPKVVDSEAEEQKLDYQIEPGIFKKLSIEASFDLAKSQMSKETEVTLDFSILYDRFIDKVEEDLLNDESKVLKTKSGGTVLVDRISPQGNVIIKHPNGSREYIVSKARLTKLNTAFENLDVVSNINDEFREVIGGSNSSAYWSVLNAIRQNYSGMKVKVQEKTYSFADKLAVVKKMTKEEFQSSTGKNFVLIIDEINRGNVSQIFGELITLIEKNKRLGKEEELKLTLPYSNDKFGVPPNLYIIGTMNTADRSVEALDTALRRRFSFREMPPIYDLGELNYEYAGLKVSDILKTINRRIEKLLDRDHLIGHSFFILGENENPKIKLIQSFYQNLIPLLQEYFYGDYAKIGAVLGNGFILKQEDFKQTEFAFGFNLEDYGERDMYQIIDYREGQPGNQYKQSNMTFEKAIRRLMNQPLETAFDN